MQILERTRPVWMCILIVGVALAASAQAPAKNAGTEKIPITTSSEEARRLYLEGRDLADKLRATDSHKLYQEAAAKDKTFALARLGLANTAGTAKEFFDALQEAVTLSGKASEPERLMILGLEAGAKGDIARQKEYYTKLTVDYPKDERGHNLLGGYYFGQQDYPAAVAAYQKAVAIAPSFSPPYNQLGYAYRFMEKYADAEQPSRSTSSSSPRTRTPTTPTPSS
jgi:tetratricopeptide (TPR) repeat protein